jgi:hypothetical protein
LGAAAAAGLEVVVDLGLEVVLDDGDDTDGVEDDDVGAILFFLPLLVVFGLGVGGIFFLPCVCV